jgi:hypothetical protein
VIADQAQMIDGRRDGFKPVELPARAMKLESGYA